MNSLQDRHFRVDGLSDFYILTGHPAAHEKRGIQGKSHSQRPNLLRACFGKLWQPPSAGQDVEEFYDIFLANSRSCSMQKAELRPNQPMLHLILQGRGQPAQHVWVIEDLVGNRANGGFIIGTHITRLSINEFAWKLAS
jgi:hypothetical protein